MVKSTIAAAIVLTVWIGSAHAQAPAPAPSPAPTPAPAAPAAAPASAKDAKPAKAAKEGIGTWTWNKVSGNWKRMRGAVKEQWGKLTHNEIRAAQGRRDVLNGYIQTRYGIDRDAADKQIDEWLKTLK